MRRPNLTTRQRFGIVAGVTCAIFLTAGRFNFRRPGHLASPAVEALISRMSLAEKAGQMTQLTVDLFCPTHDGVIDRTFGALDWHKIEEAVVQRKVGSFFNTSGVPWTAQEYEQFASRLRKLTDEHTANKIPVLYAIDAVHGANYTYDATLFPQPIAQAAAFDRDLVGRLARVVSKDVAASHVALNFMPVLDVARQPLWPRMYETYGEDTYLVGELGHAYVSQHRGPLPCLKHYLGYSAPASGRDRTPAYLGERAVRQLFLPPFAHAIDAHTMCVMANSGSVDGIPGHANGWLLNDVLREELHFNGMVVSDFRDVERLYTRDRVASSSKEAVRMAIMAGIDMSMVPDNYAFQETVEALVTEGSLPQARVDEAVRRILNVKERAGLLTTPKQSVLSLNQPEDSALNLEAARAAMTLLKNEKNVLPLQQAARVMVVGPNADDVAALNGGWTYTWQGNDRSHYPAHIQSVLGALKALHGADRVFYAPTLAAAQGLRQQSDVIVLCLGEQPYAETPGNIDDLTLAEDQLQLALAVQQLGLPVVLVLLEGRPRTVRSIVDGMAAVLMAYLPGTAGGTAIAETLLGHHNPAGRLPFIYPRATNALMTYDYLPAEAAGCIAYAPEWPFGHGLSYSTFEASDLQVHPAHPQAGQAVRDEVTITNVGKRRGEHAALLYLTDKVASVSRPERELHGFAKVDLEPGGHERISFTLTPEDFLLSVCNNTAWSSRASSPCTWTHLPTYLSWAAVPKHCLLTARGHRRIDPLPMKIRPDQRRQSALTLPVFARCMPYKSLSCPQKNA